MSRWFRLDDDVVNDPKVQRLSGEKFKAWINLLCIASKHDGVLPAVADVAFILRISVEKASSLLDEFCAAGLIDPIEVDNAPMSYEPHNWKERQFKSDINDPTAADRNKRYRDRKRNDRNATVTLTPTRTETETETEQKKDAAIAARGPEADLFDRGKEVLGKQAGGLIKNLLKAKDNNIPLARAAIEQASTKSDPREYIGRIIRNHDPPQGEASRYVDPRL